MDPELTPITVQQIRELFEATVVSNGSSHPLRIAFDRVYIKVLLDELDRLRAGRFTEEEFQGLCHCLSE